MTNNSKKRQCDFILKTGDRCKRTLSVNSPHSKCWQHRNPRKWITAKVSLVLGFIIGFITLFTNLEIASELFNKYLGSKNIEIISINNKSEKIKIQKDEQLKIEMLIKNLGKRKIENINLHSILSNPEIIAVELKQFDNIIKLEKQSSYRFNIIVKGKKSGISPLSIKLNDKSSVFSSSQFNIEVVDKPITTENLSIKSSYHFTQPYRYAYCLENGKIQKFRVIPKNISYSGDVFREPIKFFFFNRGNNMITIDEINLILNDYKKNNKRFVIGYLQKGIYDKEVFNVTLNPENKKIFLLTNKFIKLKPNDGQNILVDFNSKVTGLYRFNFAFRFFENEIERRNMSKEFELFYDDEEKNNDIVYINSFDEKLAEKLLRVNSEIWEKLKKDKIHSPDKINEIIELELDKIRKTSSSMQFFFGSAYLKDGKFEDAIHYFSAYIEKEPEEINGFYRLSDAYLFYNDLENSMAVLKKAKKIAPLDSQIIIRIARLYELQNEEELALKSYNELLEIEPDSSYPWYKIAVHYYKDMEFEKSIEYLDKAIRLQPLYKSPYLLKSLIYIEKNKNDLAWKNILNYCITNNLSLKLPDMSDVISIVKEKSLITLDSLKDEYEKDGSSTEKKLSLFIKNKRLSLSEKKIIEELAIEYLNIELSLLSRSNNKSIQSKGIPSIERENQIKLVVKKINNFDVLSGKFKISIKNISGTILNDLGIENKKNNLISFNLPQQNMRLNQSLLIAEIPVSQIVKTEEKTIQNEVGKMHDPAEQIKYVNNSIGNMAYGDGVKQYLNFDIVFFNQHFGKKVLLHFHRGECNKIEY